LMISEAHLRSAQEIAMMGSYEYEITSQAFKWSEQVYRIFEYAPGEEINLDKISARVDPRDVVQLYTAFEQVFKKETEKCQVACRIILPDGKIKHIQSKGLLLSDVAGNAEKIVGVIQDVTERKIAEEKLKESKELLESVFDASFNSINVLRS